MNTTDKLTALLEELKASPPTSTATGYPYSGDFRGGYTDLLTKDCGPGYEVLEETQRNGKMVFLSVLRSDGKRIMRKYPTKDRNSSASGVPPALPPVTPRAEAVAPVKTRAEVLPKAAPLSAEDEWANSSDLKNMFPTASIFASYKKGIERGQIRGPMDTTETAFTSREHFDRYNDAVASGRVRVFSRDIHTAQPAAAANANADFEAAWNSDTNLQAQFISAKSYRLYMQARQEGRVL